MAKVRGRKGFWEELQLLRRYSDLSEPFFNFLKEKITNGTDQEKWESVKVLRGAYEKMIPQDLTSDGQAIKIQFDNVFNSTRKTETDNQSDKQV